MSPEPSAPIGLVLPGGGARAAYQAGAISAIAGMLPPGRSPFHVIAGQSAGAINAAGLACRAGDFRDAAARMVAAWSRLRVSDVMRTDLPSTGRRALIWALTAASGGWLVENPRSFFDNSPLAEMLAREIDFRGIETAIARGDLGALAVTASVYSGESGQAVTFFAGGPENREWARMRRCGLRGSIGPEHVMASAALPYLFPAQEIGGQFYGDGALRLTAPLSPAIRLGARRLLVIAARDPEVPAIGQMAPSAYPSLAEIAGHMLDILFNDHLDTDLERLTRINRTLSLFAPEQLAETELRPVEVVVLRPSRDLREIAGRHARALPWTMRTLLRGIGGWGGDWRLPSYLNFDSGYCGELIALGHADAMANRDALMELFRDAAPAGDLPPQAAPLSSPEV
ncbi:patatin-like phospholipase family protein [Limibaculum sp. M0105]|uniref:Patatin-like phospholipase family protein n=1 Tax=Thermohalobaculum xanthum TaxID=2753746 RepID=A0A8J7M9J9_9RHOB|nr:patatin-like phospholipase family protein [Thermohalobaculum xanthum]MBK0400844.1 patatin-like phospholipase family protein [Thermohalobaculum xanthum]